MGGLFEGKMMVDSKSRGVLKDGPGVESIIMAGRAPNPMNSKC